MGKITAKQIRQLVEGQGFKCALTRWELSPETASIDHKIPLGRGGEHCVDNAQVVHHRVNAAKNTMTNEEFIEMCCAVADNFRIRNVVTGGDQNRTPQTLTGPYRGVDGVAGKRRPRLE